MRSTKYIVGAIVAGALMVGSLGLPNMAFANNTASKRAAEVEWLSKNSDDSVILWQIMDTNSKSRIRVSVYYRNPANWEPTSDIIIDGCSGYGNVVVKGGSSFECVVNAFTPLVVKSVDNLPAMGSVEFLAVAP